MPSEVLLVVRGSFSIEEPWAVPAGCELKALRRATDGAPPRLATTVSAYYDRNHLYFVFTGADDHVVATFFERDEPLYTEDVVEVFLAPRDGREYFEIEVSPVGTVFDARIESPDGERATMTADIGWNCDGVLTAVRKIATAGEASVVDTVVRVPFAALDAPPPSDGDEWRGNFFRIDRHPTEGDEYTAWSPTMRDPADFHVVAAFGRLLFRS